MLLRLLKNNRTPGIIFIAILMILIWMKAFIHPVPHEDMSGMPLYNLIFSIFESRNTASSIMSIAYIIGIILLIIRLNVINYLLEDRSFMPATFFLLISASFPSTLHFNPILISSLFLILAILILIRGDEHRTNPMALFNSTLLLAVGSLFYLNILWFIPFLWITGAIIRPLKWRGIVNPILVLIMMGVLYITYYWVVMDDLSLLTEVLNNNLDMSGNFPGFKNSQWLLLSYLLILLIVSSLYMLNRIQAKKIIIRKIYQVLFVLFIYSFFFYLFVSGYKTQVLSLIAIPVAYLLANYFHRKRTKLIHEVLMWIWIILIAYAQSGLELF
jgi:hypothetical protein